MNDNSESGPVVEQPANVMREASSSSTTSVSDIYTQATGVNLDFDFNARTGRIESSVVLGTVSSGFGSPVTFNYTMSLGVSKYYGFSGGAQSISKQFGLNMPRMSTGETGRVHFSSGLVDKQTVSDGSVSLETHREDDVNIQRVYSSEGGSQTLRGVKVSHINGIVEYYDAEGRIKEMRSESGHGLKFTVEHNAWLGADIITRIEDDEGLNWITASVYLDSLSNEHYMDVLQHVDGVTITTRVVLVGNIGGEGGTHNNIHVKKISLPGDMARWIEFTYDAGFSAGQFIKKVSLPTGQFIKVSRQTTLKFSDTQTLSVGSRVERGFEVDGAENVTSVVSYTYGADDDSKNFTGYKVFRTMEALVDNCSTLAEDYTYTVVATHDKSKVTTVYNRFHLPVSCTTVEIAPLEEVRFIQCIVTAYTYPIEAGAIDVQPANFSRWTKMTVDYQRIDNSNKVVERTRREQASRTFDVYGNLTSQTLASGIRHEYAYYAKNSTEAAGCPASPYLRFLKSKTTYPASNLPAPAGGNQIESYTYTAITGNSYTHPLDGSTVTPSMTLKKTDVVNGMTVASYSYITTRSTPFLLGALNETTSFRNSVENKISVSWSLSTYEQWRVVEATSYISATGQTGNTFAGSAKFSPLSGLVYEEEDSARCNTVFGYTATRRLRNTKKYFSTSSEEVESYEFRYWSKAFRTHETTPLEYRNTYTNRVKVTSSTGKITCWHFDHEGEPVFISHGDSDDFTQVATVTEYDRSNGVAEVIRHKNIDVCNYVAHQLNPQIGDGDHHLRTSVVWHCTSRQS